MQARTGVQFQDGALFSSLSVTENIIVPIREHAGLDEQTMREIAALKIALVGLPADTGDKKPSELSGGMRKRASLARALALDPELLFLDEPTAGLDPIGAAHYDELVKGLSRSLGLTVLMVTHDLDSLNAVCDRIAVLLDKRVVVGTMEELLAYDHPWVREYFHGPRGRGGPAGVEAASDGKKIALCADRRGDDPVHRRRCRLRHLEAAGRRPDVLRLLRHPVLGRRAGPDQRFAGVLSRPARRPRRQHPAHLADRHPARDRDGSA